MRPDPCASLAVLLARTGLTQMDAAAVLGVAGRTFRRWMEGAHDPPTEAINRLTALARDLDLAADATAGTMDEPGSAPRVLLVYRRDQDVPSWTGLPTAGCHLSLVRRVVERRPDVQLVTFYHSAYRRWLGTGADCEGSRVAWAASRVGVSSSPRLSSPMS
jgi:transcriptional regulator with XRE-family HTH domain